MYVILHSKFSVLQGQDYCVQGVVPWQRLSGWMHSLGASSLLCSAPGGQGLS